MRSTRARHHRHHPFAREVPIPTDELRYQYSADIKPIRRHLVRMKPSDEPGFENTEYNTLEVDELASGSIVIRSKSGDDRVFLYPSQAKGLRHVLNKRRVR